jgi:DNA-binding MarR family transcriptional regulator
MATKNSRHKVHEALAEMRTAAPTCAFNNLRIFSRSVERLYDDAFRPFGLSASQVALLWTVLAAEPVLLKNLVVFTSSDQTTMSRTVSRAAELDLLTIERDPEDSRLKIVRLTDVGRERLAQVLPVWKRTQQIVEEMVDLKYLRQLVKKVWQRESVR